jgi:glycosyltransferase involved in cell wall biosynthesis
MGYIIVGAQIDPHDWGEADGGAPPPVDTIVQRVMNDAQNGHGNIILMHDGGGDRSHTIAALPQIIDGLRAQGYEFVSVGSLLGQTRAQVMPPLSHQEWLLARADAFAFEAFRWFRFGIAFIFMTGILLVSGRALIIGLLALAEKLRPSPVDHPEYKPEVTVMIPAYNEETVIVDTVRSALASVYPRLEILVIDDGSSDRTAELVRANFGRDPRVRLLLQPNRGKPAALNHALAEATGEIVVSIDADTIVDPEAVPRLVRHFANPKVGAVAGNVKVMNRNKWLTRWQALEYITSQNLEKRAFDLLNCIPVVPGAAGAWRTDLLRANGGFSGDTVAEDTDLTLTIRRNGWKILYDEEAIGRTEVPAISLDFWNAASRMETSRRSGQTSLWHARLDRDSEYFPFPDYSSAGVARHRSSVYTFHRSVGSRATPHRPFAAAVDASGRRALLDFLRHLHGHRPFNLRGRLRAGEKRGLDAISASNPATLLLPPNDVRRAIPRIKRSRSRTSRRVAWRGTSNTHPRRPVLNGLDR